MTSELSVDHHPAEMIAKNRINNSGENRLGRFLQFEGGGRFHLESFGGLDENDCLLVGKEVNKAVCVSLAGEVLDDRLVGHTVLTKYKK